MTALKVGAPGVGVESGIQAQEGEQSSAIIWPSGDWRKRFATLRARFARCGRGFYRIDGDRFLIAAAGWVREVDSLDEAEAQVERLEVMR